MAKIVINRDRCKGCLLCVSFCPESLLEKDKDLNRQGEYPVKFKEPGECIGCGMCVVICPDCCIEVHK